ncbi:MAG: phage major capsid protein [Marinobacter sp.]|uniref:phage major capsid protein n=1 Tax=Marinobacter sp. UBA2678 TaxID=1946815 RepID=UPI000C0A14A2|nr:phage major capsid protein [Marinobacter sp. UBA2678]MAM85713.1 phage major capsid protein [Hahellaceae bacterium]MBI46751.1 phage major capsid protein [Marinobacter sp.]|tara:strand:- start:91 stop:1317 length:1227 start_codon:yes stop_codon:yes gene_type:complete
MKLHELKQAYNELARNMRNLHDKIGDTTWTDEQRSQWSDWKQKLDGLDEQIKREEALRDADQRFVEENEEEHRDNLDNEERGGQSVDEQRAQAFDGFLRQGMSEMSAEQRQILREMRAQATDPDTAGGYTVPTEMLNRIHEAMKDYGGLASVAQILTTDSGHTLEWPTSDGTAEEGELIGENSQASEGDVVFGIKNLGAKKLSSKVIRVSNELLNDSGIDIQGFLASRIGSRLGRGEAKFLVQGTGAGTPEQPTGLQASVTGTTTAASSSEFTWQEVNGLIHSIDPAYRRAANFRIGLNDNTLKLMTEMEDLQGRPLWLPAVSGAAPATILNVPYFVDQGIADIGVNAKFMYAGDFAQFIIRRVRYMVLKRLVERYADFDQTGFLAFHRFDCVLQDAAAIKALQGAAT